METQTTTMETQSTNLKKEIYLDYHATTPVLPEVLEAMSPYFCNHFGNANSTHQWGWKAEMALSKSSKQVADLLGVKASQVYFTSGATESLHWVIVGWARQNKGGKVITTATEHKATYGACEWASELGLETKVLDVDEYGRVKPCELEKELNEDQPTLFSFIYGNNEVGTINPAKEICQLKDKFPKLSVHADGAQTVGKLAIDFTGLNLDYLSLSGHKIYAPKGVGALLIRDSHTLSPLFAGGGQQKGMRAGTMDVPSIVGLGVACQWARDNMIHEQKRLIEMRDFMIASLISTDEVSLNGHPSERLPNNVNVTFKSLTIDKLLLKMPKVGFSSSSACSSGATSVSHVLKALGRSDDEAKRSIRLGMGYGTTWDEIKYVQTKIQEALGELKSFHS